MKSFQDLGADSTSASRSNLMTKKEFIEAYVVSFMANWAAINYTDACMRSEQRTLTETDMFAEAVYLANELWERLEKDNGLQTGILDTFIP